MNVSTFPMFVPCVFRENAKVTNKRSRESGLVGRNHDFMKFFAWTNAHKFNDTLGINDFAHGVRQLNETIRWCLGHEYLSAQAHTKCMNNDLYSVFQGKREACHSFISNW